MHAIVQFTDASAEGRRISKGRSRNTGSKDGYLHVAPECDHRQGCRDYASSDSCGLLERWRYMERDELYEIEYFVDAAVRPDWNRGDCSTEEEMKKVILFSPVCLDATTLTLALESHHALKGVAERWYFDDN